MYAIMTMLAVAAFDKTLQATLSGFSENFKQSAFTILNLRINHRKGQVLHTPCPEIRLRHMSV